MNTISAPIMGELQKLDNRLNELKRKNTLAIRAAAKDAVEAAKRKDNVARQKAMARIAAQRTARTALNKEQDQLLELEKAYERSTRSENAALKELRLAARKARKLVSGIKRASGILKAVTKFSGIIVRVIAFLS